MFVKLVNNVNEVLIVDCVSAHVIYMDADQKQSSIIFVFANGSDRTVPLNKNENIYYLNNSGKTIDKDMRMAE